MKVECYGKKKGSFVNQESGQVIDYYKIFCVYPFDISSDVQSEGREAGDFSVSPDIWDSIPVDCELDLDFNHKKKVIGFKTL